MNCREIETLLLAEQDGVLTHEQHAALAAHVAGCPACRQFRAALTEAANGFRAEATAVSVPDIESEWQAVRAQLPGAPAVTRQSPARTKKPPLAPVIWFGAPLAAAAAAVVFAFLNPNGASDATPAVRTVAQIGNSTDTADATSTVAYVDNESGWLVVWSDAKTSG